MGLEVRNFGPPERVVLPSVNEKRGCHVEKAPVPVDPQRYDDGKSPLRLIALRQEPCGSAAMF